MNDTSSTRRPRRTSAKATVAQAISTTPLMEIAKAVRKQREQMGWTIAQAAAWSGVGTRFLLDLEMAKPSLQVEMVIQTAKRFGVRVQVNELIGERTTEEGVFTQTVTPQVQPKNARTWLSLHYAALAAAKDIGISTANCQVVRVGGHPAGLTISLSAGMSATLTTPLPILMGRTPQETSHVLHVQKSIPGWLEEEGGPGLSETFELLLNQCNLPTRDIEQIVRWTILSNAMLDTEHHLGRWRAVKKNGAIELAPLSAALAGSRFFEAAPHKGLRIGSVWPELVLRADHWKKMAEIAGIHPKTVFQTMREVSARVPATIEAAIEDFNGQLPQSGPSVGVIREIAKSCARMGELTLAAQRHVSGLTTKSQPKIKPLQIRTTIEEPKRIVTDWEE